MSEKASKKIRKACEILGQGEELYNMVKKDFNNWSKEKKAEFLQFVDEAEKEKERNDKNSL